MRRAAARSPVASGTLRLMTQGLAPTAATPARVSMLLGPKSGWHVGGSPCPAAQRPGHSVSQKMTHCWLTLGHVASLSYRGVCRVDMRMQNRLACSGPLEVAQRPPDAGEGVLLRMRCTVQEYRQGVL